VIRGKVALLIVASLAMIALVPPAQSATAQTPIPSSLSSVGDSITTAFNACGFYVDCTSRSWSTGNYGTVSSHYLRIKGKNPAITGRNFNDARSGAKIAELNAQVTTAGNRGVDYVTILIGANDACTSAESTMTPVATFRSQLDDALTTLKGKVPNAAVFISSIPDIKRLWYVGHHDWRALAAWSSLKICQSMLANATSHSAADEARRDRVRQRVMEFNTQLQLACAAYGANCRFDGNATFNYQFGLSHVSGWDFFHPNQSGQTTLASITYQAGFNW